MKAKKIFALLLILLMAVVLPMAAFADGEIMYIKTKSGEGVRMRCSPGTIYDTVTKVPYGAQVTTAERIENGAGETWVHVGYDGYDDNAQPKHYDGYICLRYLSYTQPGHSGGSGGSGSGSSSSDDDQNMSASVFNGFYAVGETCTVIPSTPGNFVNMRWAPTMSMPVMARYYGGQELYVIAENRYWCQVYDEEAGLCGFMYKSLTSRGQ